MACLSGNGCGLGMMPPTMTTTFEAPPSAATIMSQGGQLSRSKSLNDISYDSQISAFASDRFINNLPNLNSNNNNNVNSTMITNDAAYLSEGVRCYKNDALGNQVSVPITNGMNILNSTIYDNEFSTTNCVDSIYSQRQMNHTSNQQHNLVFQNDFHNQQFNVTQQQMYQQTNNNQCGFDRQNQHQSHDDYLDRNISSNQCSNSIKGVPFAQTTSVTNTATSVFNICNPLAMNMSGLTEQIGNLQL